MDFSAMIQTWINAVTQPNEAFYDNERKSPNATLGTAIIWIVIAAIISGLLGGVQALIGMGGMNAAGMDQMLADLPPETRQIFETMFSPQGLTSIIIASVVITPIVWIIVMGILNLIARLLGGQGDFGRFAYLNAAYSAPIQVVSGLLGFVPFVGGCVSLLLFLYSLVLCYFTIKTEHQLSQGKSIATIVIMVVAFVSVIICGAIVLGLTIAAAIPQ